MAAKAKYKDKEKDKKPAGPRKRNDAYVMMLFISLAAIAAGCLLLQIDYAGLGSIGIGEDKGYGSKAPPKENPPTVPKLGEALKIEYPPDTKPADPVPMDPMPMDPKMDPKMDPMDPKM